MKSDVRRGPVLAVMCLALALVVSAVASLNVALPNIARDVGATQTELQWIVDAYALVFAGMLIPLGALGDRFGRKELLVAGLVVFLGASIVAAFATTPATLIGARAVAGIGAAAIMPVTLSIVTAVFPAEERDRAVGTWAAVAGAGGILGLLISGLLLEVAEWEWLFGVTAAWAVIALMAALAIAPTSKDPDEAPADPVGGVLSALGLGGVVFGIIEGPERGWTDALTLGSLTAGVALVVAFVLWELRQARPMLDPRLFRDRGFSTGALTIALQFFCLFGTFFIVLQYLQFVLGYSPLESALAFIPMALAMMPTARGLAPHLVERLGARRVITGGLVLMALGFAVFTTLQADSSYWHLLGGLIAFGAGVGLSTAPATTIIMGTLPAAKQGVASGVNNAAREVGGAMGIAVLGSVVTDVYANGVGDATQGLPGPARQAAEDSLAFVLQAAPQFGERGAALIQTAQDSFVDGLSWAAVAATALLIVTAGVVLARGPRRERQPEPALQSGSTR